MASVLFSSLPTPYKYVLHGVYQVMDRKHIAVAACIILIVTFFFAFTWNKGSTTSFGQANVVTQGGSVTLVPKNDSWKVVVTADLSPTNTPSKSSPAATPKAR